MELSIYFVVTALVIIVNLFSLRFLAGRIKGKRLLRYLFAAIIFVILWQAGELIRSGFQVIEPYLKWLWAFETSAATFALASCYCFLFLSFTGSENRRRCRLIFAISTITTILMFMPGAYQEGYISTQYLNYMPGPAYLAVNIWELALFAGIIMILVGPRRNEPTEAVKQQRKIISLGALAATVLASTTEIIFPRLGIFIFPAGGIGATIFLGSILYSMYRLHFLDIHFRPFSIRNKFIISFVAVAAISILFTIFFTNKINQFEPSGSRLEPFLLAGLMLFLVVLMAAVVADTFIKPIRSLAKAAEAWGRGDYGYRVDISPGDELGALGKAVNKAGSDLLAAREKEKKYYLELEKEVAAKTEELSATLASMKRDQVYLKEQRSATLNILDDVSESQLKLKEANDALEKRSQELVALKALSDELAGVLDIDKAVNFINSYLGGVIEHSAAVYLIIDPVKEGEFVYKIFLRDEVSDSFLAGASEDIIGFLQKSDNKELKKAVKIIRNIQPSIIGEKINNNRAGKAESTVVLPLRVGDDIMGIIHLSSGGTGLADKKISGLADAMLATFSLSLARIGALMRSQHSRTISLVENLSDGVIMFDAEKEITLVNAAATKFTGLSRSGFVLSSFYKLFSGFDMNATINEALEGGEGLFKKEAQLSERYVFEISAIPVKDNQGKVFGGAVILHDITHLKEVDRMKTEFVSVASHQLRTPLTAIKLFTEMMLNEQVGKLKKEQREYLDNIYESTERMVRLVNDLLSLSRLESGSLRVEPKSTDLHEFTLNIIKEIEPLAQVKGVSIIFGGASKNLPPLAVDVNLIRQVIHNLITNAVRYSKSGGRVNVEIKKDNGEYLLTIKDSGIGIPEKAQGRIFEKFFRADNAIKNETEGTGLGLYVSKMIVENSGGRIWFKSAQGEGTVFYVALPTKGMVEKQGSKTLPGAISEVSYS
ncbi:MAG: ATP-binding protein [Candidatus Falkowbacteria bacterium]